MWTKTGIVALREADLKEVPEEVWSPGVTAARVADFYGNRLSSIPVELGQLTALRKLRLSHNLLPESGVPGGYFGSLRQLQVLAMSHNRSAAIVAQHISVA